jgi:hypothetical protein
VALHHHFCENDSCLPSGLTAFFIGSSPFCVSWFHPTLETGSLALV